MSTRRILIPNKKLELESIIKFIYMHEKLDLFLDKDLYEIIMFLKTHKNSIKEIGYKTWAPNKSKDIRVILSMNLTELSQAELDLLDKISY